jgi:hypothetical protein
MLMMLAGNTLFNIRMEGFPQWEEKNDRFDIPAEADIPHQICFSI